MIYSLFFMVLIPTELKMEVGGMIKVEAGGDCTDHIWLVTPKAKTNIISLDNANKTVIFNARKAGKYELKVIGCKNGKLYESVVCTVNVFDDELSGFDKVIYDLAIKGDKNKFLRLADYYKNAQVHIKDANVKTNKEMEEKLQELAKTTIFDWHMEVRKAVAKEFISKLPVTVSEWTDEQRLAWIREFRNVENVIRRVYDVWVD